MKVEGTYYGLVERTDEKGRSFYTINVEGLRVEIPSAIVPGVVPTLRSLPVGSRITCVVSSSWRGNGERRWLSWVLMSLNTPDGVIINPE